METMELAWMYAVSKLMAVDDLPAGAYGREVVLQATRPGLHRDAVSTRSASDAGEKPGRENP